MKLTPTILKKAKPIAQKQLCDHCLGRQFAHVGTGFTNQQRGQALRKRLGGAPAEDCVICDNLFTRLDEFAALGADAAKGIEFKTFVVGTTPSAALIRKEEALWEEVGIEYCEPLRSELNREIGKRLQKKIKKDVDEKRADVTFVFNLETHTVDLQIRSLFIAGTYQKLVRGIPQTKWHQYPVTIEDIIAKPIMNAAGGTGHALHGAGREDIDARCLAWRPFVFEVETPKKRSLPLRAIQAAINKSKKIQVRGLRFSTKQEVRDTKAMRPEKTYRVLVTTKRVLERKDITALAGLAGVVQQKTPSRVLHRRADLVRKRHVKTITGKLAGKKTAELMIRGEAGLYIKELVTGDGGRTHPSVAELWGPVLVKELDVITIHLKP